MIPDFGTSTGSAFFWSPKSGTFVDHGNDNDNDNVDHGDEVGDEDVVARVREVCSQLRWAELGHQQLKRFMGETIF